MTICNNFPTQTSASQMSSTTPVFHKKEPSSLVGILGNGEIGSSIHKVYQLAGVNNVVIRDPFVGINNSLSECDVINICIPFFGYDEFVKSILDLSLKDGCIIIIQSTIGLGTTDKIQEKLPNFVCVHSPVRGVHPNLAEGMITFDKYLGISDKYYGNHFTHDYLVKHLESLNMKPIVCKSMESEMAKMVSTTLYGVNIAAVTDVYKMCKKNDLDFGTVFTKWQTGYNEGYTKLGKSNVCRPVLTPIKEDGDGKRVIKGHCVIPNSVILKNMGEHSLSSFVLRYSDEKSLKHVTGSEH